MLFNEPWHLSVSLFERSLALINLAAFLSSLSQWRGQIGSTGLLPARDLVRQWQARQITFSQRPTLCLTISCSDHFLLALHWTGILCSVLAFFALIPPGICILACWLCYSSLVNVSSTFMGLQMHSNLLETNMLYVVCSPFLAAQPELLVFTQWTLLFRVMLGGSLGKVQNVTEEYLCVSSLYGSSILAEIQVGKTERQCSGTTGHSKQDDHS